jgi:hypothetical protein
MKKSHVFIIFADVSFLLCGILCVGYIFVTEKKHEPEDSIVANNVLFEKGIEFPTLSGGSGSVYGESQDSIEIVIPHEGGRFIVNGKSILKTEIAANLNDVEGKSIILCIDKSAPSGDTLYLYSILNNHNANVTVTHLLEGQKNGQ